MYKYLTLLILMCISFYSNAQEKIFYDNHWQQTRERNASQYRIITPQEQGIYKVEDYYMNGQLHRLTYQTNTNSTNPKYRVGPVISFDINGHKILEGRYRDGQRFSRWTYYYPNSNAVEHETYYLDGKDSTLCYDSATHALISMSVSQAYQKKISWRYKNGDTTYTETDSKAGGSVSVSIHKKDTLITELTVKEGNLIEKCYNTSGATMPCPIGIMDTSMEKYPFPNIDIPDFLSKNIKYPVSAQKQNIRGKVVVRFVVEEDGAISDIVVVKGIGGGCDEEAVRVVDSMPYWQPGMQNGIGVKVYFSLPITFRL